MRRQTQELTGLNVGGYFGLKTEGVNITFPLGPGEIGGVGKRIERHVGSNWFVSGPLQIGNSLAAGKTANGLVS